MNYPEKYSSPLWDWNMKMHIGVVAPVEKIIYHIINYKLNYN